MPEQVGITAGNAKTKRWLHSRIYVFCPIVWLPDQADVSLRSEKRHGNKSTETSAPSFLSGARRRVRCADPSGFPAPRSQVLAYSHQPCRQFNIREAISTGGDGVLPSVDAASNIEPINMEPK
jgi:hypothetical protein